MRRSGSRIEWEGRLSRRAVLRGAGVVMSLPWLESWVGSARAQTPTGPKRYVAIYLPNGAPEFWSPPTTGTGSAWQLSSVLELLAPLKDKVAVVSGLENGSVFNFDASNSVEPAHGRLPGAWLTCTDPGVMRQRLMVQEANGISVDQIMAAHPAFAGQTALPSMQLGLSSWRSYCDGQPCSNSRSISWQTETKPLYKLVDPHAVFDQLMGVWPESGVASPPSHAARLSVLDAVKESAAVTRSRLSAQDRLRLDEFLSSVRDVERHLTTATTSCSALSALPDFPVVTDTFVRNTANYNKGVHADLMNELLALALQCDRTRIVSYMLEDERSEFNCDHIPVRQFTPLTSTPGVGVCGEWHGSGQEGSDDVYASIVRWNVGKVAELCARLAAMPEGSGSVLDNSVIFLGSAIHGHAENADRLPSLIVGGGGGLLKTDQHVDLGKRPMRDFHYTLMNRVYGVDVSDFGVNLTGAPLSLIDELLSA